MKNFNYYPAHNISRRNFKFFIVLMVGGSILTCIMAIGVQAQTIAMLTETKKTEAVKETDLVIVTNLDKGVQAVEAGDDALAIKFFSAAISDQRTSASAYHSRGCAYARLKNWKRAISDFSFAINIDSTQAEYFYHRGLAANKAGKYTASVSDCNRAINLNNQMAEAYLVRGISKALLPDEPGSMDDFKSALSFKPDYAEAYYNIGLNYYEKKDMDNAKKYLELAKKSGFENSELSTIIENQSRILTY